MKGVNEIFLKLRIRILEWRIKKLIFKRNKAFYEGDWFNAKRMDIKVDEIYYKNHTIIMENKVKRR